MYHEFILSNVVTGIKVNLRKSERMHPFKEFKQIRFNSRYCYPKALCTIRLMPQCRFNASSIANS